MTGDLAHGYIVERLIGLFEEHGATIEANRNGSDAPDILVTGGDAFDAEHTYVEVESSTLTKPAHIISKVERAIHRPYKLVFAVPADGYDGNPVRRLDSIFTDPPFANRIENGLHRMYVKREALTAGMFSEEAVLIPAGCGNPEWVYDPDFETVACRAGGEEQFELAASDLTDIIETDDVPAHYEYHRASGEYIVKSADGVETYDSKEALQEEYTQVYEPILPRKFDSPAGRRTLSELEYLIVADNEVYRRPFPQPVPFEETV